VKRIFTTANKLFVFSLLERFLVEEIKGKENIPQKGNFIVASNHLDTMDSWLIGLVFKNRAESLCFVARRDKNLKQIWRIFIDFFAQPIVFERGRTSRKEILKEVIRRAKRGQIIVFYPEGDVNKKRILLKGKNGVAEVAKKTSLPVLPLGIRKTKEMKRKIIIGKPLYSDSQEDVNGFFRKIMLEISKLSGKAYPYD